MSTVGKTFKIGDVYLIEFTGTDSEQTGVRPGLVIQNNAGNLYSPNIIVLPLTTKLKKRSQPTHVFCPASDTGLKYDSMVLCESPVSVSKRRAGKFITTIPEAYMRRIAAAYVLATSAISFLDKEMLIGLHRQAVSLNAGKTIRS